MSVPGIDMYAQNQTKFTIEWGEGGDKGIIEAVDFYRTGIQKVHLVVGTLPHREQSEC